MTRTTIESAEDFDLEEVILTSNRFDQPINITNIVAEINIYESIFEQYLTGSILVIDTVDLYRSLDIQGTERLKITVSLPSTTTNPLTKNFVIVNAEKASKIDDFSTAYIFNLIEDVGYLNEIQKISKVYDGKGEDIILNILQDNFNKTVSILSDEPSYQANFRYILPYEPPLTAVKKILNKITTKHGSPFFAFSTLSSSSLKIIDLDTILKKAPHYSRSFIHYNAGKQPASNIDQTAFTIYNYKAHAVDDTLYLSQLGVIGSTYHAFNLSSGAKTLNTFNIQQLFESLKADRVVGQDQTLLIDSKFVPDPLELNPGTLASYSGRFFNMFAGSTYNTSNQKVFNYTEEASINDHKLKINRYGLLQFLEKNSIHVSIPGALFITGQDVLDVGSQINVYITLNTASASDTQIMEMDNKNSGKYIIINKRHVFNTTNQQHYVTLQLSRLSYSSSITDHRYTSGF